MSYEWIVMIVMLLVGIFVFEIAFAVFGVRLTTGQEFRYYYDTRVDNSLEGNLLDLLLTENETFSYDIMLVGGEVVDEESSNLTSYLQVHDGDVIFTDSLYNEERKTVRANGLIDFITEDASIYCFDSLLRDGRIYLSDFLLDEYQNLDEAEKLLKTASKENLSTEKIDQAFLARMKKDNRFRTDSKKEEGKKLERERIFRLVDELNDFAYLLEYGKTHDIFYKYTRYTQLSENAIKEKEKTAYTKLVEAEKEAGRENAVYGLKMESLINGKHAPQEIFKLEEKSDASGVVLMVFNFFAYQRELQFETVSFINSIVRSCSDIYSNKIV